MVLGIRARLAATAAAVLLLTTLGGLATASAATGPDPRTSGSGPVRCTPFGSAVATAPGARADQKITGTLCRPRSTHARTVQLLLHGGTYDRSYWTRRGDPRGPSYVEAAGRAGLATLAVDRLGTGRSSAPHSSRFTDRTHELVTLQLIRKLRRAGYDKVILVGHSFGATVARMVAVRHPEEVDGLILTGEGSPPNHKAFEQMGGLYLPANRHPLLARRGLDDGYTSLRTGGKADWFYDLRTTDPGVLLTDEFTTEPDVYPADPAYGDVALNRRIRVPVLVVVGERDKLICGAPGSDCSSSAALRASAAPLYGPKARLEALAVPATGHVLNLHRTAPLWYAYAQEWANRRVGGGS
ncbi:alpha/beta hydrolase [Streptomyces sp. NPDC048442]|uniref:alpha/beta hydrolase n=1 Tax=Streptomyces sp. NPDC048442 TaxID=3154823 RepID=UPI00344413B7